MIDIVGIKQIKYSQWDALIEKSRTATWFQTEEAYSFFDSFPFLEAFVIGVENEGNLKGTVVGYIQKDGGKVKQFFSRRAIVLGGPLLDDDISDDELDCLLVGLKNMLKRKVIYIETRNFVDYSPWRNVFERCGFAYEPHLNFQVDCTNWATVEERIGKHRRRYIRLSIREGIRVIENPTEEQVIEFYKILESLYKTKIKTSLFPISFFVSLFKLHSARFILMEYNGLIIGGSACVCLENCAVYEWFACGKDKLYRNVYPSSITKYAGMKYASDHGFKVFDMMGAGKPDEEYGVRDFKAEFGGKLVEQGRYVCVCNPWLYAIGRIGVKIMKMK